MFGRVNDTFLDALRNTVVRSGDVDIVLARRLTVEPSTTPRRNRFPGGLAQVFSRVQGSQHCFYNFARSWCIATLWGLPYNMLTLLEAPEVSCKRLRASSLEL